MIKNIITIALSLFIISPLFAQMPYDTEIEEENLLIYNEATDKQEPQYMWGAMLDYKSNYNKFYGLGLVLKIGAVPFSMKEDGVWQKPTNISNKELALKNKTENELNTAKRQKELSNMITKAFQIWFEDTKAAIEKAGRQDEFRDIMPILTKSVKPTKDEKDLQNAKKYHFPVLHFYFTTENNMHKLCGSDAGGCKKAVKSMKSVEITIVNPYTGAKSSRYTKNQIYIDLIHEIGHYYGLADQYIAGAWSADKEYSTEDRVRDFSSVMSSGNYTHLTCDDVDGFINLIDLTLSKQNSGKFSARAQKGWASFCNGKNGYRATFYKNAKPVNKKADACVYDVSPEGKVGAKYCPKLWSFARPNDKLTYGRNGLLTNKKDEKFNYNYSYVREQGVPSVKVTITNSGVQRTSSRKIVNGKKAWELPNGYYVSTDGGNYIQIDKQNCNIVNFIPFSDKKSYSVNFINDKLQSEYTYSFPVNKKMINMRKSGSKENRVCTVSWLGDEIIKFEKGLFFDELTDKKKDNFVLKDLAEETKMTKDQLIERLKTECKKDLHQSIIENAKALCSYFRTVDDYFSK